jgi:DNA polymerase III delta subunit
VRSGETLADWRDAILADDSTRALRLTELVLGQAGTTGVRMVAGLGTALLGLALARSHYDRGLRGSALERVLFDRIRQLRLFGLGDWKELARDWARWSVAWPERRVRDALRATLQADRALKGTRISDESGVLVDLVLNLSAAHVTEGSPDQPHAADRSVLALT